MNKSGKKARKVYVYNKNLELEETFETTADCARALGISQGNIVLACQGVLKSYKGMYFSYTPLNSQEDLEKLHKEGEDKRNKRDNQVDIAQIKYRQNNKDKLREIALRYYYNHREEMLTYQKERYHRLKNERIQDSSGTTN